jgi:hypothetical protein
MSMRIIKKNSSSPFHLQRSMVDQGGAYEGGGFNPASAYSDTGLSEGIAGLGKILGAGLSTITRGDVNKMDIKKQTRLEEKKKTLTTDASNPKKLERVSKRLEGVTSRVNAYSEFINPTMKSDITDKNKK